MNKYIGSENLEVMSNAVNYNLYLTSLVQSHCRLGDSILDFGAGLGSISLYLSNLGYSVQCVEPDVAQASNISSNGLLVTNDIANIEDNSLDFIFTLNVLEHIENDLVTFEILYKKLKKGGNLLVYVPAFQLLYSSMDKNVGHFRRYKKSGLVRLSRKVGFNLKYVYYADSIGFFASLVYKLVGDRNGFISVKPLIFYDKFIFPLSCVADKLFRNIFGKNIIFFATK